jgi:hypothetical protein
MSEKSSSETKVTIVQENKLWITNAIVSHRHLAKILSLLSHNNDKFCRISKIMGVSQICWE